MTVREDEIERDNGARGIYGVVEKCDSAIILPIDGDQIYLVEQFRYPIGENSLEFPQGSLERNDVDPAEIAREELQAETGLVAEQAGISRRDPHRLRLYQPEDVCASSRPG